MRRKTAQIPGATGAGGRGFTLVELPGVSKRGFTLVELLVVVGIIALLVSILLPTLGRAKDGARKASCATNIANHGKTLVMYVNENNSYPHFGPWPWHGNSYMYKADTNGYVPECDGWPKFNAILQAAGHRGQWKTKGGNWYYGPPIERIWRGCFCPAMDAPGILQAADKAGVGKLSWPRLHPWAIGYQWNAALRAKTNYGRNPAQLKEFSDGTYWGVGDPGKDDKWQWVQGYLNLPDGKRYFAQAVTPEEIFQPGNVAEGWDSWDSDSIQGATYYPLELVPGWHAATVTANGRAALNATRHRGCPNILYADGHVASDATRPITNADEEFSSFPKMNAVTWSNFDSVFGNLDHIAPKCEFYK